MEAREIDRRVAECIMGWTEQPCDLDKCDGMELTIYDSGDACCPRCGVYGHISNFEHGMIPPRHYSRDMNAAWDALKSACLGYPDRLANCTTLINELFMRPQQHDEINTHYMLGMMCAWTPEMICLAILKAYGSIE